MTRESQVLVSPQQFEHQQQQLLTPQPVSQQGQGVIANNSSHVDKYDAPKDCCRLAAALLHDDHIDCVSAAYLIGFCFLILLPQAHEQFSATPHHHHHQHQHDHNQSSTPKQAQQHHQQQQAASTIVIGETANSTLLLLSQVTPVTEEHHGAHNHRPYGEILVCVGFFLVYVTQCVRLDQELTLSSIVSCWKRCTTCHKLTRAWATYVGHQDTSSRDQLDDVQHDDEDLKQRVEYRARRTEGPQDEIDCQIKQHHHDCCYELIHNIGDRDSEMRRRSTVSFVSISARSVQPASSSMGRPLLTDDDNKPKTKNYGTIDSDASSFNSTVEIQQAVGTVELSPRTNFAPMLYLMLTCILVMDSLSLGAKLASSAEQQQQQPTPSLTLNIVNLLVHHLMLALILAIEFRQHHNRSVEWAVEEYDRKLDEMRENHLTSLGILAVILYIVSLPISFGLAYLISANNGVSPPSVIQHLIKGLIKAFITGILMYVSYFEILPKHHSKDLYRSISMLAGFAVILLLSFFVPYPILSII